MTAKKLHTAINMYKLYLLSMSNTLWAGSNNTMWLNNIQYAYWRSPAQAPVYVPTVPKTCCYFLSICGYKQNKSSFIATKPPLIKEYPLHAYNSISVHRIYIAK